jgi:hypothetical protein
MALIPSFFLDCVAAIGVPVGDESGPNWIGSGFFYGRYLDDAPEGQKQYVIYLVSNKHVFGTHERILIRANPAAADAAAARDFSIDLRTSRATPEENTALWIGHPDEDIDVAVTRLNYNFLLAEGMQASFFASDDHSFRRSELLELGITEGDFVYVLGFPMGLVGEHRSVVIVRNGTIARIRDALAGTSSTYLIDASVFPGNSDGPVVLKPEVVSITGTEANSRAALAGIVRAYVPYRDVAVSLQTGNARVIFEENSGLVEAHPIDAIDECIDADPLFRQQQIDATTPPPEDAGVAEAQ